MCKTKTAQTMATWLSPSLPHTCADQQQQPFAAGQHSHFCDPCSLHLPTHCILLPVPKQWGHGAPSLLHTPCNKATAGSWCFLYFLHFQQFAKLKYTHLLSQGHHLEHDQDYEICILSLSEQSASRWDNTLISCCVSNNFVSLLFFFFFSMKCTETEPKYFQSSQGKDFFLWLKLR